MHPGVGWAATARAVRARPRLGCAARGRLRRYRARLRAPCGGHGHGLRCRAPLGRRNRRAAASHPREEAAPVGQFPRRPLGLPVCQGLRGRRRRLRRGEQGASCGSGASDRSPLPSPCAFRSLRSRARSHPRSSLASPRGARRSFARRRPSPRRACSPSTSPRKVLPHGRTWSTHATLLGVNHFFASTRKMSCSAHRYPNPRVTQAVCQERCADIKCPSTVLSSTIFA